MSSSRQVLLLLDNLRIGGIQRLALDEAYALNRRGYRVKIILLESVHELDDMREIDAEVFQTSEIDVISISGSSWKMIRVMSSIIRSEKIRRTISHSAKGVAILRIASFLTFRKIKIRAYIHQLISLSSSTQRAKRLVLFSLADELHASSKQFVMEIENYLQSKKIAKFIFRRKINFDRMGVDLNRLFAQDINPVTDKSNRNRTILFMSRVAIWKGFGKFVQIAKKLGEKYDFVVITSRFYNDTFEINRLCSEINARLIFGSNVAKVNRGIDSIHLYPADYGKGIKYPQNIGLNVLESIALGIPSLISIEEFWSWPELSNSTLVWTTDWSDVDVQDKIRSIELIPREEFLRESQRMKHIISIEKHVDRLIRFLE